MQLSVIIPVLNGGDDFRSCLASIQSSQRLPDELIVVIDGHDPISADIARQFTDTVLINETTQGPAYARNRGTKLAQGEILIFFDADVTVHADTIGQIDTYFQDRPTVSALIGSYDDEPAGTNFLSQYKNLMHHYVHQTSRLEATTFWGACGAIRREAFMAVDGFDEQYTRPCIEDIELGYRLTDAGYTIHLVPQIQVKHHKVWTPPKLLKSDIFDRAIPWSQLILTQNRLTNDLNVDTTSRISTVLVYLLVMSLIGGILIQILSILVIVWVCGLLWLNRQTYAFLFQQGGIWFLIRALFWHWLYYFYSGLVFVSTALQVRLQS